MSPDSRCETQQKKILYDDCLTHLFIHSFTRSFVLAELKNHDIDC
jgi:hypothetical protein